MALSDVKAFLKQQEAVRNEMKADMKDFEEALAAGHITEDQLTGIKEEFDLVDTNYQRLLYIMYLFEIPNRNSRRTKFLKANQNLIKQFSLNKSDAEAIKLENESALTQLRAEIKRLKTDNK